VEHIGDARMVWPFHEYIGRTIVQLKSYSVLRGGCGLRRLMVGQLEFSLVECEGYNGGKGKTVDCLVTYIHNSATSLNSTNGLVELLNRICSVQQAEKGTANKIEATCSEPPLEAYNWLCEI